MNCAKGSCAIKTSSFIRMDEKTLVGSLWAAGNVQNCFYQTIFTCDRHSIFVAIADLHDMKRSSAVSVCCHPKVLYRRELGNRVEQLYLHGRENTHRHIKNYLCMNNGKVRGTVGLTCAVVAYSVQQDRIFSVFSAGLEMEAGVDSSRK